MEISGKVINILQVVSGEGKTGNPWKKQEFVIEYQSGQYPKKLCFSLWGDKIDSANINMGEDIKVFFDVESREYNGKYFTDIRAWKVEKGSPTTQNFTPVNDDSAPWPVHESSTGGAMDSDSFNDDLPF